MKEKTIKSYLRQVRQALPCSLIMKTAITNELRERINEELSDKEITLDELYDKFGTPDEVLKGFDQYTTDENLQTKVRRVKSIFIIISIIFVSVIGLLVALLIIIFGNTGSSTQISNFY